NVPDPRTDLRHWLLGRTLGLTQSVARRSGGARGDGPEDIFGGGLHGSLRLGAGAPRGSWCGVGAAPGQERLGANRPQASVTSSERAAPVAPAAGHEPEDDQEKEGANERHD